MPGVFVENRGHGTDSVGLGLLSHSMALWRVRGGPWRPVICEGHSAYYDVLVTDRTLPGTHIRPTQVPAFSSSGKRTFIFLESGRHNTLLADTGVALMSWVYGWAPLIVIPGYPGHTLWYGARPLAVFHSERASRADYRSAGVSLVEWPLYISTVE